MKKLLFILFLLIVCHEAKSNVIDQFNVENITHGVKGSMIGLITGVPLSLAFDKNNSLILTGTTIIGAVVGILVDFDNGKINIHRKEEKKYDFMNFEFNYFCDDKIKNQCILFKKFIFVQIKY